MPTPGARKFARRAEGPRTALFRKQRGKHRVTRGEREHPAAFRAAARDGHHHAKEIRKIEFVAPETVRLHGAKIAGVDELIVGVAGELTEFFA
jgi:hypothetical protein